MSDEIPADTLAEALALDDLEQRKAAVSNVLFTLENHARVLALAIRGFLSQVPADSDLFDQCWALGQSAEDQSNLVKNTRLALAARQPAPVIH